MFKFLKTFIIGLVLTYCDSFNVELTTIVYNDNKVSFTTRTDTINSTEWWLAMELRNEDNTEFYDQIVCWKYNDTINIDAFTVASDNFVLTPKSPDYLLTKNITVNEYIIWQFSRLIDTSNNSDIRIGDTQYVTILKGEDIYPSKSYVTYTMQIFTNIKFEIKPKHIYTLKMFYPTFATIGYFILYFTILLSLNFFNHKNKFKSFRIPCLGYQRITNFIFKIIFSTWWISMYLYSIINPNLGTTLFRLGVFIMLNIAFILIPVTRNSILILLFKLSHKDLTNIHVYTSILCLVTVITKFIFIFYNYPLNFLFVILNTNTGGSPLAGTIATFAMVLSGVISMPYIKKKCFEVFYITHRFLSVIIVITSVWHYLISLYYIIPSILLYATDIILRYLYTKKGSFLKLNTIGDEKYNTSCVVIKIKLDKFIDTPPGCYFLICVRNISSFEWHPFSLIRNSNNSLVFCAKDMGLKSWTGKLKSLSDATNKNPIESYDKEIYIQGPYNYFDIKYITNNYSYIINVAGGIGVTPIISILEYVNEMLYLKKLKNIKKIYFIWIVQHISFIDFFNEKLIDLDRSIIDIEIYVTKQTDVILPNIKCYKPDINKLVNSFIAKYEISLANICILGSGPKALLDNIKYVSNSFNIDNFCEEF